MGKSVSSRLLECVEVIATVGVVQRIARPTRAKSGVVLADPGLVCLAASLTAGARV